VIFRLEDPHQRDPRSASYSLPILVVGFYGDDEYYDY
jgi:hypothetical protein